MHVDYIFCDSPQKAVPFGAENMCVMHGNVCMMHRCSLSCHSFFVVGKFKQNMTHTHSTYIHKQPAQVYTSGTNFGTYPASPANNTPVNSEHQPSIHYTAVQSTTPMAAAPASFHVPLTHKDSDSDKIMSKHAEGVMVPKEAEAPTKMSRFKDFSSRYLMRGIDYDVHAVVEEDPVIAAIHANAVKWDDDTEYIYGFMQVISAICVIFAHGAGEVGYMAGPLAVIVDVCQNPANNVVTNNTKVMPEIWVILIGAFGLVIGLATYGYKVCGSIGTQMARITPSRGFAAELATSFVIMVSAQWGLPTSSSQCITGENMNV
jgi:phosphate/sulfate permease